MAITYTQLCGMPRSERSSTAPEKWEVFVIHMLAPQPLPSSDNFFFFRIRTFHSPGYSSSLVTFKQLFLLLHSNRVLIESN